MQLYIIQYPSMYPNGCSSQRLIVANNNLVRSVLTDDERGEKTKKLNSKCLQPRWCPSDLSRTQKRRLQVMCKKISGEPSGGCTVRLANTNEV